MLANSWVVKVGIVGALLTFMSNSLQKRFDQLHEQECLSVALKCEIQSILTATERGTVVDIVNQFLKRMQLGEDLPMPRLHDRDVPRDKILETMYPIFHVHMKDIGILDKNIVEQLAVFYSNCMALQVALIKCARGDWDGIPIERKIKILEYDLEMWRQTRAIGENLLLELDRKKGLLKLW